MDYKNFWKKSENIREKKIVSTFFAEVVDKEVVKDDALAKSPGEAPRWLSKKFDIQGVVFLTGLRPYMWYAEGLLKTYNAVDRTFCDAIKDNTGYVS